MLLSVPECASHHADSLHISKGVQEDIQGLTYICKLSEMYVLEGAGGIWNACSR